MTRTVLAAALSLALLAACERADQPAASGASTPPSSPSATTRTVPADLGTPSSAEKREGANPTQGQVDPKEPEQRKDFQQRGDAAGPKN